MDVSALRPDERQLLELLERDEARGGWDLRPALGRRLSCFMATARDKLTVFLVELGPDVASAPAPPPEPVGAAAAEPVGANAAERRRRLHGPRAQRGPRRAAAPRPEARRRDR